MGKGMRDGAPRLRQIGNGLLKLATLLEGVDNFVDYGEYYSTIS